MEQHMYSYLNKKYGLKVIIYYFIITESYDGMGSNFKRSYNKILE